MSEILRYDAECLMLANGTREWHVTVIEAKLLNLLALHIAEWVTTAQIAAAVWPAVPPDYWRNCVHQHLRGLATKLLLTSCRIESAHKEFRSARLGYRRELYT